MINFNKNLLINKKAFILGGSGLIGNEVTKLLLSCGCTVVNLDLKENSNFESLKFNKKKLKFFKFDCKNEKVIKNYKKVVKKYGIPDIFVNCSYPKTKDWKNNSFKKIKFLSLKKNIDTNLVNSSFLIREVAEMNLKKRRKCSIVLVSSIYGLIGQDNSIYKGTKINENISYSIIKGGIINLTKQMSSYYSKFGIRINNVCPGGVFDKKMKKNKFYKKLLKNYSYRSPIGRMADPSEVANPIVFLATEGASYITGSTLIVDGGWTAI